MNHSSITYIKYLIYLLSTAAVITVSSIAHADTTNRRINRLFITPTFRSQIDLYRNNPDLYKPKETITRDKVEEKSIEPITPTNITVKGVLTKPDGTKIAWIKEQPTAQIISHQKDVSNDAVLVKLGDKKTIQVKAGQVFQIEDNSVRESFSLPQNEDNLAEKNDISNENNQLSSENSDQSVEEPHEITKTLIDIVNNKRSANRTLNLEFEP